MRGRQGFTLIELIVVITIIGILGTFVTVKVLPLIWTTKKVKIEHDLKTIVEAAKLVTAIRGSPPITMEELVDARDSAGNPIGGLEEMPLDPWKRPYSYTLEGDRPVATCLGRDDREGGEGEDEDLRFPPAR